MEPSYILHSRPYSNSSLLLDCFTFAQGRITAIAKGVKTSRNSSKAAILQPFTPLELRWRGRGEVKTMTTCESVGNPLSLNSQRLYCGLYVNELLVRLLSPNEPYPQLFAEYSSLLTALEIESEVENLLRHFELSLLAELGYGAELGWDNRNNCPVTSEAQYAYVIEEGPIEVNNASTNTTSGSTLIALSSASYLNKHQIVEARRLMRTIISHYLGGKPLKSRELFVDKLKFLKRKNEQD